MSRILPVIAAVVLFPLAAAADPGATPTTAVPATTSTAVTAPAAAAASATPTTTVTAPAAAAPAPAAPAAQAADADPMICHYESPTGSRLDAHRVCAKRSDWDQRHNNDKTTFGNLQNKGLTPQGGGMGGLQ